VGPRFGQHTMTVQLTPSLFLTDERPESRDGIPVLVTSLDAATAYGPADILTMYRLTKPAAHFVTTFARQLTGADLEAARRFCAQWPDGPQVR
jgi:hypothetical protein